MDMLCLIHRFWEGRLHQLNRTWETVYTPQVHLLKFLNVPHSDNQLSVEEASSKKGVEEKYTKYIPCLYVHTHISGIGVAVEQSPVALHEILRERVLIAMLFTEDWSLMAARSWFYPIEYVKRSWMRITNDQLLLDHTHCFSDLCCAI